MLLNRRQPLRNLLLVVCLAALVSAVVQPGLAQSGGRLILMPLDLSAFPQVTFLMEAYHPGGAFMDDLEDIDVRLVENGEALRVEQLTRLQSGLHVVAAFNIDYSLNYRYGGKTPLEHLRAALLEWAASQAGAELDEFSLVSNSGGQATKMSDPEQWQNALSAFSPDFARAQSSTASLAQAIDLVTDAGRRTTSKRVVLWITPPLAERNLPVLPNLAERANQLDARLFIWLVVPPGSVQGKSQAAMQDLAWKTGGQLAVFNLNQPVPDLEPWLQPLRYIYQLEYSSAVRASGTHRLQVQVIRDEANPAAAEQRFTLTLLPPNPIFISPPISVQRAWQPSGAATPAALAPENVRLRMMVEFPDKHPRAVEVTRLYVDGALVSQSNAANPTSLTWPLEDHAETGSHTIRVEVQDILGFTGSSIEIPVQVEVPTPPAVPGLDLAFIKEHADTLLAVGAGALGLVGLVLAARWLRRRLPLRRKPAAPRAAALRKAPANHPPARHVLADQHAPARLVPLAQDGLPLRASALPLYRQQVSLGSDPQKASMVVESTTMDGLHALINPVAEQDYLLTDAGSLAGTWVNTRPVPPEGTHLRHGDLVHLGLAAFRFELKSPPAESGVHIRRLEQGPPL